MNRDSEAFGMLTGIGSPITEVIRPYVDRIVVLEKMRTDLAELHHVTDSGKWCICCGANWPCQTWTIINREDTP